MKRYFVLALSIIVLALILSSCFIVQKPAIEDPVLLLPANNTSTSTNVTLIWKEPNASQPLEYKVFFGTSPNPSYVTTTQWLPSNRKFSSLVFISYISEQGFHYTMEKC